MYPIMQEVSKLSEIAASNPQKVMQDYMKDPQVKYLLALNEAKRLKDAMQRNQAMQAPTQPTVMQVLEQQSGLASLAAPPSQGDMAQDVGGVLQFQARKQQENLQRMAQQGLPAAPGAGAAMTPQAMAAGGIVAFSAGDQVPDYRSVADRLRDRTRDVGGQARDERRRRLRDLAATYGFTEEQLRDPESLARQVVEDFERAPAPGGDRVQAEEFQRGPEAGPTVRPPPAAPNVGAAPTAAPTAAQAPIPSPGASFPTLGAAPISRAPSDFERNVQGSVQSSMVRDPLSEAERVANVIRGRMDYTPEERKPAQQQRAGLEALLAERRAGDRERQLSAFLRSAGGGRTFGETLGRGSAGAAAVGEQTYRERLKGIEDIGRLGMEDVERGRMGRVEGAKQIGPLAKQGIDARASAERAGVDLAGTLSREGSAAAQLNQRHQEVAAELQSKGMDRQNAMAIAIMRQRSEEAVAEYNRESTSQSRRDTLLANLQQNLSASAASINTDFNARIRNVRLNPAIPNTPEARAQSQEIARLETERDIQIARNEQRYAAMRNQMMRTGGARVEEAQSSRN